MPPQPTNGKPIIFLAFANDPGGGRYLRNLPRELGEIRGALDKARRAGLCEVVERANVTLEEIFNVFQEYKERIAIFHYGGHADSYKLLLESRRGRPAEAHSEGLVPFLARQDGLQLVFINGCCTEQQARELRDAGVPAVIGTAGKIDDNVAAELAIRFYSGLGDGLSIERCWQDAEHQLLTRKGKKGLRDLHLTHDGEMPENFPWDIYYHPGAAQRVKDWNLPDAAADPLFGLSPVPEDYYRSLPPAPFIGLNYFTREQAAIFFGRGAEIRRFYEYISGVHPVILFYGQSGVGKSSLLFAGLTPRLERDYAVQYLRRDPAAGLGGTLRLALQQAATAVGSNSQPETDLPAQWRAIEAAGKPLILILDQAEEIFTQPARFGAATRQELSEFLHDLQTLFSQPNERPQGKLVLSYRKDYLAEFLKAFRASGIPYVELPLEPLARNGIIEAVKGVTVDDRLQQKYRLALEDGGGLPEIIADDLLEDAGTALAPVLQILLTRLWKAETAENPENPCLTIARYQQLKKEGIAIGEFFEQQMGKLREWNAEVVDSGLALDVLYYFTTELGTAAGHSGEDLRRRYRHREEVLDELVGQCKSLYLLTERGDGERQLRLAHDILAPVIRKEYSESDRPGQRAGRVLENKRVEISSLVGIYLDESDLRVVEKGQTGMPALDVPAEQLLMVSRRRRAQQIRNRKILWGVGLALVGLIMIAGVIAWIQKQNADQQRREANYNLTRVFEERALKAYEEHNYRESWQYTAAALELELPSGQAALTPPAAGKLLKLSTLRKALVQSWFSPNSANHDGPVTSVAFSPDGKTLASGSIDQTIRLWDIQQKKEISRLIGHSDAVLSVAFSPDGKILASGSIDQTIRLWDIEQKAQIAQFVGHTSSTYSVAFSPDGKILASGLGDATIRLWDIEQKKEIVRIIGHSNDVNGIAFSPDGKTLASASDDTTIWLWDIYQQKEIAQLEGHSSEINSIAFSPDGKTLASGSADNTIRLWNIQKDEQVAQLTGHTNYVFSVAFSPDGKILASASGDATIRLWDIEQRKELSRLAGHTLPVYSVAFSPDGKILASGSGDATIRLWDIVQKREITQLAEYSRSVSSVTFSPDGKILASGSNDATICLWDIKQKREIARLIGHSSDIKSVAFSPNGKILASGSDDSTIGLWDIDQQKKIIQLEGHSSEINSIAFSPDGKILASGSRDASVRLWNIDQRKEVIQLAGPGTDATCVAFSPDGKILASGFVFYFGDDVDDTIYSTICLWDVEQEKEIARLAGHSRVDRSVAFSPDGKTLASGSIDATISLWDIEQKKEITRLTGHKSSVNSVAFSSDGKMLASASDDTTIRLWDIDQKKEIAQLAGHSLPLYSVAFSPDGRTLASGSDDATIRLWDIKPIREFAQLTGHRFSIRSVAFSPDGKTLASGSYEATIRLWDIEQKKEITQLVGFSPDFRNYIDEPSVNSIAFSPNGNILASGSDDATIRLWDIEQKEEIARLIGHSSCVYNVAFSPNGKILASGSLDNTIRLWDIEKGEQIAQLTGHTSNVSSVAFSPDGKILASGSGDATIRLWDIEQKEEIVRLIGHSSDVRSIAFGPDGKTLASGSHDNTIRLWDVEKSEQIAQLTGHENLIFSVTFSPGGNMLASASGDNTVRLWDIDQKKEIVRLTENTSSVLSVAFSPDGKILAFGSGNAIIYLTQFPTELIDLPPQKPTTLFVKFMEGLNFFWQIKQEGLEFKKIDFPRGLTPQNGYNFVYDPKYRPLLDPPAPGQDKYDQILAWAKEQQQKDAWGIGHGAWGVTIRYIFDHLWIYPFL